MSPLESCLEKFGELRHLKGPGKYSYIRKTEKSRILISKGFKDRSALPAIVMDIDGVFGFWDEQKCFNISERSLTIL